MGFAIALLLVGAGPAAAPASPVPALSAVHFDLSRLDARPPDSQIEREYLRLAPTACLAENPEEIVVCARSSAPRRSQRLPLADLRFADGEVVRHPGEAPGASLDIGHSCVRPGSCEPSRLMDTLGDIATTLITALKGEDKPVPPIP